MERGREEREEEDKIKRKKKEDTHLGSAINEGSNMSSAWEGEPRGRGATRTVTGPLSRSAK